MHIRQKELPFLGGTMNILIKTDLGTLRIINTTDILFVEGNEKSFAKIYLKNNTDFPIRVGVNIRDFYKVLNGEDFFKFCELDKFYVEHTDGTELKEKGLLKEGESSEEEIKRVKEAFAENLETVPAELDATKKRVPSFSKKKQADAEKKVEVKEESTGSAW